MSEDYSAYLDRIRTERDNLADEIERATDAAYNEGNDEGRKVGHGEGYDEGYDAALAEADHD